MKLLDMYEGYDPLYLIAYVQRGLFRQTWRGSLAKGWYQPKNGKTAHGRILGFLNHHAFEFRLAQQKGEG